MIQRLIGNNEAGIYSIGVIITSVLAVIIFSIDARIDNSSSSEND